MILEKDLTIDEATVPCSIDFDYFYEDNGVIIRINSIHYGDIEVSELVAAADIENLNWLCQKHYEDHSFSYWEQRYEERNSGLARD